MNTYDELQKEMTLTFDTPISFEKKKNTRTGNRTGRQRINLGRTTGGR